MTASASASPIQRRTFSELYCVQNGIDQTRFAQHVLRRTLYPHARLLKPVLDVFRPDHFAADLDLIRAVGLLRRMRDVPAESEEYVHHPANTGMLRHTFRLRTSSARLHRVMRATLHTQPPTGS